VSISTISFQVFKFSRPEAVTARRKRRTHAEHQRQGDTCQRLFTASKLPLS